ncbi:MAG TPA: D-glycerate dehydrogenase [Terriglobia bacterium]|jgi:glyoxylate reductase|nr:D-glycerate dehydrogenase [Terriglobia bacterium]
MKPLVFITRPLPPQAVEFLATQCEVRMHSEDAALTESQLVSACADAEGILVVGAKINQQVLRAARPLKIVANCGVGYDNIDVAACTERRILVTNTPGVLDDSTADLAFALLLATARRVAEGDRLVREGRWHEWKWNLLWGADVHHKTLGLLGFGRIGQAVARRAQGFSMRILYHSRRRVEEAVERQLGAGRVDLDTLLRESDFLSIHVPLTSETRRLIGARELALMKPSAMLINTARGKVVDEEALVQALDKKLIAGAGLDVFENEPQLHPALIGMTNVVLTPHIGSASHETRLKMAMCSAENLLAGLAGRRPPNIVNPEVLPNNRG